RRAIRLHSCAVQLANQFNDEVPTEVDVLLTLPGIGDYTARAVACFAYQQRVPVVDTNVRRVVARAVHGLSEAGNPSATKDMADTLALLPVASTRAAQYSAALMEFGALVCVARAPKCELCPINTCAWFNSGKPASTLPRKKTQTFIGTDRQVRGKLLDVLRESSTPVQRSALDMVWLSDTAQRDRALDSLLVDGLIEQTYDGRFALSGEGGGNT
ncbi:MAG: A/G-specific adenine glycosylase, partial [Mycobacteriaceae bacterium]